MLSPKNHFGLGLFLALLFSLAGCSGDDAQRVFSADPQASQWGNTPKLPTDFPGGLNYPDAKLQGVQQIDQIAAFKLKKQDLTQQTRWATTDTSQRVQQYYSKRLQKDDWQLTERKLSQQQLILIAKRDSLHVRVTIPAAGTFVPVQADNNGTKRRVPMTVFFIDYAQGNQSSVAEAPPQPGDSDFIGPINADENTTEPTVVPKKIVNQISPDLQTYVQDLQQLEVLDIGDPNQPIQRGTFARWLVVTNNRLYRDRPTQQIRVAATNQEPVFKDVSSDNSNFPYIQGLAEAGFIPSPLSGDADQTAFQPNQPLTRESLLQWKVPVDFRKILPSTTTAKVQEVWGFKDTDQISAPALTAVFADHNNGELANMRRLLGSALLFQPQKAVTRAEAAATLWFIGVAGEGYSAKDVMRAEKQSGAS